MVWKQRTCGAALCMLLLSVGQTGHAQAPASGADKLPAGLPTAWVQTASDNELRIVEDDGTFPIRYLVHKIDRKGDTLRDTMESRDGSVARLIARDGRSLTSEEDSDERQRLNDLINSPSIFEKHHKRNVSARAYSSELIGLMPKAMISTYAPGQPQPAGATSPQVVIDFKPDPRFQPPTMIAELLTGIEGRLWIDARLHVVTRGEAHVVRAVNFGWGMLAHIYPGGTVEFEQAPVGDGHWLYSHLDEHLKIREVMVKTVDENTTMTATRLQKMPTLLSYEDAIRKLLEAPLPAK